MRFTIKVPNHDDGEDLGTFEAECLPRVGETFVLFHPRVCRGDDPFVGKIDFVCWEAMHGSHKLANNRGENLAAATVWLVEDSAAPAFYCTCTSEERERHGVDKDSDCVNCGCTRRGA